MPRIRNNGLYTGHSGEASHDICASINQHIRHMDTYMYTYGFRSATHMSYPERSSVQLAYLYLHDSLPETAGNTVNCSVFCIFQDVLRLVKLHVSFTHYPGKFISMYWCICKTVALCSHYSQQYLSHLERHPLNMFA